MNSKNKNLAKKGENDIKSSPVGWDGRDNI